MYSYYQVPKFHLEDAANMLTLRWYPDWEQFSELTASELYQAHE